MKWVVLTVVMMSWSASAQTGPADTLSERSKTCPATVCIPGSYEFRFRNTSDFSIDDSGTKHGVLDMGWQRWRVKPRVMFTDNLFLEAEADLITGRLFGDEEPLGSDFSLRRNAMSEPTSSDLRQLYVSWRSPVGLIRIGQQASHFGLGILANGGNDEDHDVFDDPHYGDIVERVLFATKPFKFLKNDFGNNFVLAGGFDVVFRDDNADLTKGDLAMQGLVSLMYRTEPFTAGIYVAVRDQEDDDKDTLRAEAYDMFIRWTQNLSTNLTLKVAAEVAFLRGETTRVAMEQAPEGVDIIGLGAAFQTSLHIKNYGLETRFEAGYATGDNNRNDDLVRQFKFDPGYHVGMILFQEVMARVNDRTVQLASNPEVSGRPPKGVEQLSTKGAITNAIYINPVIRWRSNFGLRSAVGALFAWSAADLTDPWQSALHGGYNYNFLGAKVDSKYLGTELNGSISYAIPVKDAVSFVAGVQSGLFFPGGALKGPNDKKSLGSMLAKTRVSFDINW